MTILAYLMQLNLKVKIGLIMTLTVLLILTVGFFSYKSLTSIVDSINPPSRPDRKLLKIRQIAAELEKAENSVRIFTISHDQQYLQQYYNSIKEIDDKMNGLRGTAYQDTLVSKTVDTLSHLVQRKVVVWNDILNLYRNQDIEYKLGEISRKVDSISQADTSETGLANFLSNLFNKKKDLKKDVTERQQLLERVEDIRDAKESNDALIEKKELALAKSSTQITNKIYDLISILEEKEKAEMKEKAREAEKQSEKTYFLVISFSLLGTLLALLAIYILTRFLRKTYAYQNALKRSKQASEELVRAKETFIANVSHELRTPMNAISGFTEQMLSEGTPRKEHLNILKSSSDYLLNLINELLEYSKLQSNKMILEPEHFSIKQLVSELVSMFQFQASEKNVELTANTAENVPATLYGDKFRLKQIIMNLLSNAVKFSENGQVSLAIKADQHNGEQFNLIVQVTDTGIGIDEEKIDHIFDDFTQEQATISKKYGGTGLGLSIVKKLTELHQGTIQVNSVKNQGSEFTCTLPYRTGNSQKITTESDQAEIPDLSTKNALVVDDADYNRKLLRLILSKWGASVTEAENGKEAIEKIKESRFDFLLLDVRMPILDGYETARTIRQEFRQSAEALPIFAITAISQAEEKSKFNGLEINDFLVKPVSEENLANVLIHSGHVSATSGKINGSSDTTEEYRVLDLSGLKQMAGNDRNFIISMLDELTEMSEKEFDHMESAIASEDYQNIAEIAHKMVSPYRHTSNAAMYKTLKEIEYEAKKENNIHRIQQLFSSLKNSFDQLKKEIEAYKSYPMQR
jgi:signal transduction histidine kinase/CheY-like chemotaxis protein/HPt (histidine-containing phosphotransfer) domain-containing protein